MKYVFTYEPKFSTNIKDFKLTRMVFKPKSKFTIEFKKRIMCEFRLSAKSIHEFFETSSSIKEHKINYSTFANWVRLYRLDKNLSETLRVANLFVTTLKSHGYSDTEIKNTNSQVFKQFLQNNLETNTCTFNDVFILIPAIL